MSALSDAITLVETTQAAYQAASSTVAADQELAAAQQAKADAATAQVTTDQAAVAPLAQSFDAALDNLSAVALAAKI